MFWKNLFSFCLLPRHHECLIIATQKPTMSFKLRETKKCKIIIRIEKIVYLENVRDYEWVLLECAFMCRLLNMEH